MSDDYRDSAPYQASVGIAGCLHQIIGSAVYIIMMVGVLVVFASGLGFILSCCGGY